jgi:hypothetical protein
MASCSGLSSRITLAVLVAFAAQARAQTPAASDLSGDWLATVTTSNVAGFRVYLTAMQLGTNAYAAYSRPGALRPFMSWRQYWIGRVLGKLPPRLAAVRLDSMNLWRAGDSTLLRGVFTSQLLGTYQLYGSVRDDTLRATLRADSAGRVLGSIEAVRSPNREPVRDYAVIAQAIRDTMRAYVFDPRLMDTPGWRGFFDDISKRFALAHDDSDAMVAFYSQLPRLKTSHINLTYNPRIANMSVDSALARVSAPPESLVTLFFPAPGVAHLSVRRWHQVSDVIDSAFRRIVTMGTHTLVLDIRGNPGGDQSGVTTAGHLFRDSMYVGALLGNRWYRDHDGPPTVQQRRSLPHSAKDDLLATFHALREQGVVLGVVTPRQPQFTGKVFLLTNGGTGSASEPLAHLLKQTRRATLVGERTAGAILAAVPHPIGDGWVLVLPEADYYTAEGIRLEGRGVHPDVRTPWREALLAVADSLRAQYPYAAALVAVQGLTTNVQREEEAAKGEAAERWAREAMRLGPDSVAPIAAMAGAFILRRQWDKGFAVFDSLLARHKQPLAVHYQIGRLSAMSGARLDEGERSLREYVAAQPPPGAPSVATGYWRLGMILEKKGDRAGARRAYESGLALESRNANLLLALRQLANR